MTGAHVDVHPARGLSIASDELKLKQACLETRVTANVMWHLWLHAP